MARRLGAILFLILTGLVWVEIQAHQQPSFPGHNAQQPPEVHHQGQVPQQNQPNQASFGGEQARDEG